MEPNYRHFESVYFEKRVWVPSANISNYVLMFSKTYIGDPDVVGKASFRNFIETLAESEILPRVAVFWSNSVKVCVEGSPLLSRILSLEKSGVKVLVCAHALDALGLKNSLRAGRLANNLDLLEAIHKAQKVVNL